MIFNDAWLANAKASETNSWVNEVVGSLDTTGQIYLSKLRLWFDRFTEAMNDNDKAHLQGRLENFDNDADHLGGVNELTCWALIQREGHTGEPLPTSSEARPDFQLEPPADCFIEVSTLNLSEKEQNALNAEESTKLNHPETVLRLLRKLTDIQKQKQLQFAAERKKAIALAIFDYTTWSAYGTQFFRTLGDALLGRQFAFKDLPRELSAIIYLERKVSDGLIVLSRQRSAIYHNPLAWHAMRPMLFPSLIEFNSQVAVVDAQSSEPWIVL